MHLDTNQKIGWIGLGSLGLPCIRRLADHEIRPSVWARNADLKSDLSAEGFSVANSACELASGVDVIFLSLSDEMATEDVVFGDGGVSSGLKPGSLLVDCSTISPQTTREFARRLADTTQCNWVDAPVSGGAAHVANGKLVVMAGGEEGALDQAQKLMAPLCKRFTRLGPVGSGQTLKACIQLVTGATVQALAEGLSVIDASGLDPEIAIATMGESLACSEVLRLHGPRLLALLAGDTPDAFPTHPRVMRKDLEIAASLADSQSFPMPLATLIASLYRRLEEESLPEDGQIGLLHLLRQR